MRSKHFKARHTASGLLSYFAAEAAPQRAGEDPKSAPQQAGEGEGSTEAAKVVQLALDIISLVDNLQKIANENCSPDEVRSLSSCLYSGMSMLRVSELRQS